MTDHDTARELERLRAETAALEEARAEQTRVQTSSANATESEQPHTHQTSDDVEADQADIQDQLKELGTLLATGIKDSPTITALAIFSCGILLGSLLR